MFQVDDESATHYLKRTGVCEGTKETYFAGYPKADYEPIGDGRWVDVMEACTLNEAQQTVFLGKEAIAGVRGHEYRYVKERLWRQTNLGNATHPIWEPVDALRVERKETA